MLDPDGHLGGEPVGGAVEVADEGDAVVVDVGSFCLPLATRLSAWTRSGSSMSTLRNPAPSDMIWNPPLSVNVGPGQFMNAEATRLLDDVRAGLQVEMIGVGQARPARRGPDMLSGNTALTEALVPTAMKAGVRMSPCGVWMTPVRPRAPASSASTVKYGTPAI